MLRQVPRAELEEAREEAAAARAEAERLRRAVDGMTPRARLDAAQAEAERAARQNDELQELVGRLPCVRARLLVRALIFCERGFGGVLSRARSDASCR